MLLAGSAHVCFRKKTRRTHRIPKIPHSPLLPLEKCTASLLLRTCGIPEQARGAFGRSLGRPEATRSSDGLLYLVCKKGEVIRKNKLLFFGSEECAQPKKRSHCDYFNTAEENQQQFVKPFVKPILNYRGGDRLRV